MRSASCTAPPLFFVVGGLVEASGIGDEETKEGQIGQIGQVGWLRVG